MREESRRGLFGKVFGRGSAGDRLFCRGAATEVALVLSFCCLASLACAAAAVAGLPDAGWRASAAAAAAQGGGRIRPPEGLRCDPDRLTSFTGRVTNYRRGTSTLSLRVQTDEGTVGRITIYLDPRVGAAKHFLIEGEPFKPADWKRIERAPRRLRAGMRATVWVCGENSVQPVVDWRPGAKSPGTVY